MFVRILIFYLTELVLVRQKFLWFMPMTVVPNIAAQPVLLSLVHPLLINPVVPTELTTVATAAVLTPENVVWLVPIRSLLNRLTLLILILLVMTEQPNRFKPGGSVIPVITKAVILVWLTLTLVRVGILHPAPEWLVRYLRQRFVPAVQLPVLATKKVIPTLIVRVRVATNHRHVLLLKCKRLQHLRNVLAVQLREHVMLAVLKIVRSKE